MVTGIVTAVIAALLISAILAAIKSRWLYVVAPKLYLNTPISDGQIISLQIYNAGLTAEEDVAVTFRQACKFELIGTSKSTLAVTGKTLSVPKLSRLESITVVLLIEGKAFDPVDIESVESKSAKGKVVESKEKATAIWQNFVVVPILVAVLAVPFALGTSVGAEEDTSAFDFVKTKLDLFRERTQLAGYKVTVRETTADAVFDGAVKKGKISIKAIEVLRQGDLLTITTRLTNNMKEPMVIEGFLKTSAGEGGPVDFWDGRFENVALGPGESRTVKQKAFLPERLRTKFIDNRVAVENLSGSSLQISYLMQFD
jgi:hypothetical protein